MCHNRIPKKDEQIIALCFTYVLHSTPQPFRNQGCMIVIIVYRSFKELDIRSASPFSKTKSSVL